MSRFAVVVWHQLRKGDVEAGDLISKTGRDELVKLGLVEYRNGKWGLV